MLEAAQSAVKRRHASARSVLREALVTGTAIVVPFVVTVVVLSVLLGYIQELLKGLAAAIALVFPAAEPGTTVNLAIQVVAPVLLLAYILLVGLVVNSTAYGERAVDLFDGAMSGIPGVGSVYDSFRQMGDIVLESDGENFREVKLVEFPHEDAYTLGFVTTETPEPLAEATDHESMLTLFLPLAPNPVMGGHLVHLPADKVMDVDMTVEEGIRAVVTSGVAVGQGENVGLSQDQMAQLSRLAAAEEDVPKSTTPEPPGAAADDTTVEPAANQPTGGDGKEGSAATDGASVPTATDSGNRPGDDG
jgi:uncharacterized membrane protein